MLNDGTKKHNVVALDEDIGGTTQETKNTEPTSSQLSSMSIKEARKELRKGAQLVIIQLSKDGEDLPTDSSWLTNVKIGVDGAKKEEITQLLEKHKKCFPKQLPMRLPPERPVSHEITVEQGSAPPSRPPFRLSQPELDELRKQLESLMNHGFHWTKLVSLRSTRLFCQEEWWLAKTRFATGDPWIRSRLGCRPAYLISMICSILWEVHSTSRSWISCLGIIRCVSSRRTSRKQPSIRPLVTTSLESWDLA